MYYHVLFHVKTHDLILSGNSAKIRFFLTQGSRLLKNCSFVDDKEIKEYEGSAHNLFMELPEVRKFALEQSVCWVKDRC